MAFVVNAAAKVPFSLSPPLPIPPPLPCSPGHLSDQFRARNGGFLESERDRNNVKLRVLLL